MRTIVGLATAFAIVVVAVFKVVERVLLEFTAVAWNEELVKAEVVLL